MTQQFAVTVELIRVSLISKQLLRQLVVDFGNQLFGLNIIEAELLSSEQARVEEWIINN